MVAQHPVKSAAPSFQPFTTKPALKVLPQVLPLEEHAAALLLHADCAAPATAKALELELFELGTAIVPALFQVIEQGSLPQQAVAIQVLLRFGAPVRQQVARFCRNAADNAKTAMAVSFLQHHLAA